MAADAEGLTPRQIADRNNRIIVDDLQSTGLSYDLFTRTTTANHDAIGTRVTGVVNGTRVSRTVRTGSSYLSQSELVLSIGLGQAPALEQVVVEWPGRPAEPLGRLAAGARYDVTEGRGVVARVPYRR